MVSFTKADFIKKLAKDHNMTQVEAGQIIDDFVGIIHDQVLAGNDVRLVGFGTFKLVHRNERHARNIRTGEPLDIPAHDVPAFKPSTAFKDEVKNR